VQESTGAESQIGVHIRLHRFAVLDALVESYLRCGPSATLERIVRLVDYSRRELLQANWSIKAS
jgi:hypothetical protein